MMVWGHNMQPWDLRLSVMCGAGRCRVEVTEATDSRAHVATIDVTARTANAAALQAFRLLAEQMAHLQREAGR